MYSKKNSKQKCTNPVKYGDKCGIHGKEEKTQLVPRISNSSSEATTRKERVLRKIANKEEVKLRELFMDILGVDADISSIIEKYVLQDYLLKQSLNDPLVLAENKEAKIELKALMKEIHLEQEKVKKSKYDNYNTPDSSPKLFDFKENKYLSFYDGSLNYFRILEIFNKLYNCTDSTFLEFEDMQSYFNLDNATKLKVYEVYGEYTLNTDKFSYVLKSDNETRLKQEELFDIFFRIINGIINNNNYVKLEELDIRTRFIGEWNYSLRKKENQMKDLGEWKYVTTDDKLEHRVNDLKLELPITCTSLSVPNLTGLTPNFIKPVEILYSAMFMENYNQLYLIKTMENLKVYKHADEDIQDIVEDIKLYLDYDPDNKTYDKQTLDKIEKVIRILEKKDEKEPQNEDSQNEDSQNEEDSQNDNNSIVYGEYEHYILIKELVLLSIEKGFIIKFEG